MLTRIREWWQSWRKPHQCPQCPLRCKSKQGLGRHIGAHVREMKRQALALEEKMKAIAVYETCSAAISEHRFDCGVPDCILPMPHSHFQEAK